MSALLTLDPADVNRAVIVRCNGCDAVMGNVISTLCRHDRECSWHDVAGCKHGGYCYRDAEAGPRPEVVLPAEAGVYASHPKWGKNTGYLAGYWASRALGDPTLSDEDREMALAAYSRSFDAQMGVTKGPKNGLRPGFPNEDGGDFLRRAEARRRAADAVVEDGALFSLTEVTS